MASYPSGLRDRFAKPPFAGSNPADASLNLCPGDGIGRHDGLKIRWLNKPWRFESALGHFFIIIYLVLNYSNDLLKAI